MSRQGTLPRTRSRVWLNLTTCGSIKHSNCAHFWPVAVPDVDIDRLEGLRTVPKQKKDAAGTGAHFCAAPRLVNQVGAAPKQYVPRPPAATKAPRAAALRRAAAADDKSASECLLICVALRARYYGRCGLGFTERTQRAAAADDGATTRQDGATRKP